MTEPTRRPACITLDSVENETTIQYKPLPIILLMSGAIVGAVTAVVAFTGPVAVVAALGAATAVIAIWLTFIIARRQDAEAGTLKNVVLQVRTAVTGVDRAVERMHELLKQSSQMIREMAERDSAHDYEDPVLESSVEAPAADASAPQYRDEAIAALRASGAPLNFDALEWRAKEPLPPRPGNYGWFVESPGSPSGGRWFVRKARGMTVRKAMPREFLNVLEKEAPLNPREIKLDYQIKEHGLAAWYARTYSGALWKVWLPNRDANGGVRIEKVEDEQ